GGRGGARSWGWWRGGGSNGTRPCGAGGASMVRDYLSFIVVSIYLTFVLFFLLLSGRLDPNVSLRTIAVAAVRRLRAPRRGPERLADIAHEGGPCYTSPLTSPWGSDQEGWSRGS